MWMVLRESLVSRWRFACSTRLIRLVIRCDDVVFLASQWRVLMGEFARGHEEWVVEVTCARYARVLWLLLMLCLVLFVVVSSVLLHCLCFFMRFPPNEPLHLGIISSFPTCYLTSAPTQQPHILTLTSALHLSIYPLPHPLPYQVTMHHSALLRSDSLLQYTQLALMLLLAQLIKHLHEETSREYLEQAVSSLESTMYVNIWGR